jgi:lysophospholipase L1-like esterase
MDMPGWRARFLAKQAEFRSGPCDLLWLGDSIVAQFEQANRDPRLDYRPIWERLYAPRRARNFGFAGDTTSHLLWRVQNADFGAIQPRLAILLIGANNFGGWRYDAHATASGIHAIIASLRVRLPQTKILLLSVLPSIRSAWTDENTTRVNEILASRYANDGDVTFADIGASVMTDGAVDPDCFVDPQRTPPMPPLHPTAIAQARFAEIIEPVVARLMSPAVEVESWWGRWKKASASFFQKRSKKRLA